jgi:hypothetical protein
LATNGNKTNGADRALAAEVEAARAHLVQRARAVEAGAPRRSAARWASGDSRRHAHRGRGLVESGAALRYDSTGRGRAPCNQSSRSHAPSVAGRSRRVKAASAPFAIGPSVVGTSGWRTRSCGRRRSTKPSSPGARSAKQRSGRRQRERDGCHRCRRGRPDLFSSWCGAGSSCRWDGSLSSCSRPGSWQAGGSAYFASGFTDPEDICVLPAGPTALAIVIGLEHGRWKRPEVRRPQATAAARGMNAGEPCVSTG